MLLLAKILLTVATLGYSAVPAKVDSDETHLRNPSWDAHARFHVMWQVSSYVYMGILALYLIWFAGGDQWSLWLAALLGVAAYGGFWTAVWTQKPFKTELTSKVNPVPPIKLKLGTKVIMADANLTAFTVFAVILGAAILLLLAH